MPVLNRVICIVNIELHFIMAGKQAKILSDQQTSSLLVFASSTRNPRRNHLILLLSLKAGLRAGEIANLTWDMVLGPTGEIGSVIELRDCAAKKKSGRRMSYRRILVTDGVRRQRFELAI